ncbi:Superoxide dismutase [Cu-Zn] [Boothiomyces sp. JEL0866]|nr:Superoxide dismutase [Cu-Zn] [Boothiomyces sp. JEL0866]KAJ3321568.1 Superoxide dismutase [Cu-Zn] [Boothiomyces sp. JEL0866]
MHPSLLLLAHVINAKSAVAQLKPDSTTDLGANVSGTVTFEQPDQYTFIKITLDIKGLAPSSTHGWHVHNLTVPVSQNCTAAGPHFNPMNKTHGAPEDDIRHFGDLGNFVTDANGKATITVTDRLLSLFGDVNVNALNRGLVIHQNPDDLGKGNATTSLTTGNAGGRLACGNIVEVTNTYTTSFGYATTTTNGVTVTQSIVAGYSTTSNPNYNLVSGSTAIGSAFAFILALGGFLLGMI